MKTAWSGMSITTGPGVFVELQGHVVDRGAVTHVDHLVMAKIGYLFLD